MHPQFPAPPNPHAINIVILGDGYDEEDLGISPVGQNDFAVEADQFLAEFTGTAPFNRYLDYFNVYRIDVASVQSGIGIPAAACDCAGGTGPGCENSITNTAYEVRFGAATSPFCQADANPDNDCVYRLHQWNEANIQQVLDQFPNLNFSLEETPIIMLANTPEWGGAGTIQEDRMIASACAPSNDNHNDKAMHEFGHSFGKLFDEYFTVGSECWTDNRANMHDPAVGTAVPWQHWQFGGNWLEGIEVHQHQETGTGILVVHGLNHWDYVPGATHPFFKPTHGYNCIMEDAFNGHDDVPGHDPVEFCAVCREQIVARIHDLSDPVSGYLPSQGAVNNVVPVDLAFQTYFSIEPKYPSPNTLEIRWFWNGQEMTAWEGLTAVTLGCADVPAGDTRDLEVRISDNTNFGYAVSDGTDPQDGDWIRLNYGTDQNDPTTHDYNEFTIKWEVTNNNTADLWIKDRTGDTGSEDQNVSVGWPLDESPSIWMNDDAGSTINEAPDFNSTDSYIYAKIENRGCADSDPSRTIQFDFTPAVVANNAWPSGTYINIGSEPIDQAITPGTSIDFMMDWDIQATINNSNWVPDPVGEYICILGQVNSTSNDPTEQYSTWNALSEFIFYNNNVSHRNTNVINFSVQGPIEADGIKLPPGGYVIGGNPDNQPIKEDITFSIDDAHTGKPLTDEAEVYLYFKDGYFDISTVIDDSHLEGMEEVKPNLYLITDDHAAIRNIDFPAGTEVKMYLGFSFLTKEVESNPYFKYHVRQMRSVDGRPTGAVHYELIRDPRYLFEADAGGDKEVNKDEQVTVEAEDILEDAIYNWYDMEGNLIFTGKDLTVTADITKKYRLEVISEIDGYKDYSEVEVKVKMGEITNINPNPANNQTTVSYHTQGGSSAYIAVFNVITGNSDQYILPLGQGSLQLDLSNYQTGSYEVLLVTDGEVRDNESLMVE